MKLVFSAKINDRPCEVTVSQPKGYGTDLVVTLDYINGDDKVLIDMLLLKPEDIIKIGQFFK